MAEKQFFEAVYYEANFFGAGMWRGGRQAELTVPGIEYIWTGDRLHYKWQGARLHWAWMGDRLNWRAEEEL